MISLLHGGFGTDSSENQECVRGEPSESCGNGPKEVIVFRTTSFGGDGLTNAESHKVENECRDDNTTRMSVVAPLTWCDATIKDRNQVLR